MVVKAAIGTLKSMSDAQLIVTVQNVIAGVTGNPKYPTPLPAPATLTTALNAFTVALADAANGGTEYTAIKNAKRNELVSLMTQLAAYITVTANGDLPTLLSSNFPIQKPSRTPVGPVTAPFAPTLKQGSVTGQLYASARRCSARRAITGRSRSRVRPISLCKPRRRLADAQASTASRPARITAYR